MKKIFLGFTIALSSLFFFSCMSSSTATTARIPAPQVQIADLTPESYTVVGKVSGIGKVKDNTFGYEPNGDTGKYGSLDSEGMIVINTKNQMMGTPLTTRDKAYANAVYQMIEMAETKGADAIIFVQSRTTVQNENGINTVEVKVTGVAIKIK